MVTCLQGKRRKHKKQNLICCQYFLQELMKAPNVKRRTKTHQLYIKDNHLKLTKKHAMLSPS